MIVSLFPPPQMRVCCPDFDSVTPRSRASIDAWMILVNALVFAESEQARFILLRAIWHNRGNGCRRGNTRSSIRLRGVTR